MPARLKRRRKSALARCCSHCSSCAFVAPPTLAAVHGAGELLLPACIAVWGR